MTFNNFNLCHDCLDYAAYSWSLRGFVSSISRELILGQYAPQRGELVRAAKSNGLSRPLCFLTVRDALVFKALVVTAKLHLIADAEDWVELEDQKQEQNGGEAKVPAGSSFDWFSFWLAEQGMLKEMMDDETVDYFVESDIANFYPSIRLDVVREHLLYQTNLTKEAVRLCVQIIDGVMPRSDYSETSLMGLPQEQLDASRPIAHSLLVHVDKEFQKEGVVRRYSRYMDDIVMTVPTVEDGESVISRLQARLESIGLYPNPSKTRIVHKKQFVIDHMVEAQADLSRIQDELEGHVTKSLPHVKRPPGPLRQEILDFSSRHRAMEGRPRLWGRVTRQLYTVHRDVGIKDWWPHWKEDLAADPGSASQILEYVRAWPLKGATLQDLITLSERYCHLYANVSLLAAEVVLTAPVGLDRALWEAIASSCRSEFRRLAFSAGDRIGFDRMASSWLLAAWKYGDHEFREVLLDDLPKELNSASPLRSQALPLFFSVGDPSASEWISSAPGLDWESSLAIEYLRNVKDGDKSAASSAFGAVRPKLQLKPQRYTILPRSVPLLGILKRSANQRLQVSASRAMKLLTSNPRRLRDRRLESLVQACLD